MPLLELDAQLSVDGVDGWPTRWRRSATGSASPGAARRSSPDRVRGMLLVVDVGNTQTHFGVIGAGDDRGTRALAVRDRP